MNNGAWKNATLADLVVDTIGGLWGSAPNTTKPEEIDVLVVRGADFRNWRDRRALVAAPRRIPLRALERRQLNPGDLVLEVSGGSPAQPVGRVLVIDERACCQDL
jgi:type I restriction enzyme, S subunit